MLRSLQKKTFLAFVALTLGALLLVALSYNIITTNLNRRSALQNSQRELNLIVSSVDGIITHIVDYAISISVDSRVINMLSQNPTLPESTATRYQISQSLNQAVSSIMGLNRNVYKWDLVTLDGELFAASGYDTSPMMPFLTPDFFSQQSTRGQAQVFGPFTLEERTGNVPVFIVCKPVLDLDNRQKYGYLIFLVKESSIASIFRDKLPDSKGAVFYIINQDGTIVSATDSNSLLQNFIQSSRLNQTQWEILQTHRSMTTDIDGEEVLLSLVSSTSRYVNWSVISSIPLSYVMRGQKTINQVIFFVAIFVGIISLLISFFISRSISRPIQELSATIMEAAKGDLNLVANASRDTGDVQILYSGFNNLMATVNRLMQQIYEEQKEKNEYQFQLLQSQVKPHFLYNSLQTIKALIDLELNDRASEATSALSSFYRLSLSKGREIIFISEEICLSKQYLYIQKIRHAGHLDYVFNDINLSQTFLLPKMTLQPILENAICHGIKEKRSSGTIHVTTEEDSEYIIFTVTDDGVGIPLDKLRALHQALSDSSERPNTVERTQSFGLVSVHRRLRLLAGGDSGITIDSREGEFTSVIIRVNKMQNQLTDTDI